MQLMEYSELKVGLSQNGYGKNVFNHEKNIIFIFQFFIKKYVYDYLLTLKKKY